MDAKKFAKYVQRAILHYEEGGVEFTASVLHENRIAVILTSGEKFVIEVRLNKD